jgi:hypothetical protein
MPVLRLVSRRSALALLLIGAGSAGAAAVDLAFDLRIEHGRVPDTMRLMRVHQGDVVKLRCFSDRPVVLHLHGYDIEKRLAPGAVFELAFTASATGRFPIEIHRPGADTRGHVHAAAPLAVIEVYPR